MLNLHCFALKKKIQHNQYIMGFPSFFLRRNIPAPTSPPSHGTGYFRPNLISTISQRAHNIISTSLWNWSKLIFRISMNYGVSAQLTKLLSLVSVVAVSPRHLWLHHPQPLPRHLRPESSQPVMSRQTSYFVFPLKPRMERDGLEHICYHYNHTSHTRLDQIL